MPVIAIGGFCVAYIAAYFGLEVSIFGDISSHLLAASIIFVVTAILFVLKVFGAGDAKMASAYALWLPLASLPTYLVVMTLVGGVLGLLALLVKKSPLKSNLGSAWIETLQKGGSAVPYGIAIAVSFIFVICENKYLSLDVLKSFAE